MSLKSDINRLRRINDGDLRPYLAAQRRHEARLIIHQYETYDATLNDLFDEIDKTIGESNFENDQSRKRCLADYEEARGIVGEDSPERWRADQHRIERYLLCTRGNLDEAQNIREWGLGPETMWEHSRQVGLARSRWRDENVRVFIEKRAAIEAEKGSPVHFDNFPRYGTPTYADGDTGDPSFYPKGWSWPLPLSVHNWICVIEEVDEITLSDEERLEQTTNIIGESFGVDFTSLRPAPGEQFPRLEYFKPYSSWQMSQGR